MRGLLLMIFYNNSMLEFVKEGPKSSFCDMHESPFQSKLDRFVQMLCGWNFFQT